MAQRKIIYAVNRTSIDLEGTEKYGQVLFYDHSGAVDVLLFEKEMREESWFEYQEVETEEQLNDRLIRLISYL